MHSLSIDGVLPGNISKFSEVRSSAVLYRLVHVPWMAHGMRLFVRVMSAFQFGSTRTCCLLWGLMTCKQMRDFGASPFPSAVADVTKEILFAIHRAKGGAESREATDVHALLIASMARSTPLTGALWSPIATSGRAH
jgi:hypothetical protein